MARGAEKIIHKFLFFLVNFVGKFAQVFISKLFLGVLKMLSLSLVHLASLPGTVHTCKQEALSASLIRAICTNI